MYFSSVDGTQILVNIFLTAARASVRRRSSRIVTDFKLLSSSKVMKYSEVLACSFSEWYPLLKKVTFPSQIIPLPKEFVDYLLADNLVLRSDQTLLKYDKGEESNSSESEDDEEAWAQAESETPSLEVVDITFLTCFFVLYTFSKAPHFEDIDKQIISTIADFGGKVFIKLNWSSPKVL